MKKIIVPVDFSACSDNALKNAIVIAKRMNLELVLLHSYIIPVAVVEHAPGFINQELDMAEDAAQKQLTQLEARFPGLKDVPYRNKVEGGTLLDSMRSLVDAGDVAMVVMGTHGASGLQRALLGSNAYSIMKHLSCPVIALPEDADIKQLKRVALGGDYKSIPSPDCLKPVIELARAFYAEVQVIHISPDKDLEHGELDMARGLEKYLKHIKHSFHFHTDMDVEDGLVTFAKENSVDLLAMISKRHSFLERLTHGSETRRMMLDIPMPLMVMHE